MGVQEPVARDLRDSLAFQRRAAIANDVGGTQGDWATIITGRSAKLTPYFSSRGNYEVAEAARLQGIVLWICWIRFDSQTSGLLTTDRACDARTLQADGSYTRTFNIRFCEDMNGRRRWLQLALEEGVAPG